MVNTPFRQFSVIKKFSAHFLIQSVFGDEIVGSFSKYSGL
jgi:hypothetical protein